VPRLKDRLENALNECRILMLGVQVLIGFDFRSVFEEKLSKLPVPLQDCKLAAVGLLLVALALLYAPIPYHWIAGRGMRLRALHDFTQRAIEFALFPFALAMSMDVMVASSHIVPRALTYVLAAFVFSFAGYFWYARGYYKRGEKKIMPENEDEREEQVELKDRIKEVLVETRLALPGVQATLGFQFIIVLAASFESLPQWLREVHLASLLCSAVCAVLLIAPAAYHRIALDGGDSEDLVGFASALVLLALVPLAVGLAGDVMVVAWKITGSIALAASLAGGSLLFMLGFWFGYMYWRRIQTIA
jgi:uncharacterized protein DUF6328